MWVLIGILKRLFLPLGYHVLDYQNINGARGIVSWAWMWLGFLCYDEIVYHDPYDGEYLPIQFDLFRDKFSMWGEE